MSIDGLGSDLSAYFTRDSSEALTRLEVEANRRGYPHEWLIFEHNGETLRILTIRSGTIGAPNLMVRVSGVHGPEGFAGAAGQLKFLTEDSDIPDNTEVIDICGYNAFGFRHGRRWNENNVDLNRNHREEYHIDNPSYSRLNGFINPQGVEGFLTYWIKTLWVVICNGFEVARQAVAGGQTEFPAGVFYAGAEMEEAPRLVRAWLQPLLAEREKLLIMDLHTGYGPYGEDTVVVEYPVANPKSNYLREALDSRHFEAMTPGRGAAAWAHGNLPSFIERIATDVHNMDPDSTFALTLEIGTLGALRSFRHLRNENALWHEGNHDLDHPVRQQLIRVFNPEDVQWQRNAVEAISRVSRSALNVIGT